VPAAPPKAALAREPVGRARAAGQHRDRQHQLHQQHRAQAESRLAEVVGRIGWRATGQRVEAGERLHGAAEVAHALALGPQAGRAAAGGREVGLGVLRVRHGLATAWQGLGHGARR
jgi:hypothetical protein